MSLASQIRITSPDSVLRLVSMHNEVSIFPGPHSREAKECELACRDVLVRLEHLILASNIPDEFRIDQLKGMLKYSADVASTERTRHFAALARVSVVHLAGCISISVRSRAIQMLVEALSVNSLSDVDDEIMQLNYLLKSIVQFMEKDSSVTQNEDLLKCLLLTFERLNYAATSRPKMQIAKLLEETFESLVKILHGIQSCNPHLQEMISTLQHEVQFFKFRLHL